MADGDHGDAGAVEESPAPRIVRIDDAAQRVPRGEQHRLCFEVLLHRLVVVEMVVTEVGEDADVEVDALDPRLDEGVARYLHGDGMARTVRLLAVAHAGQDPLDLGRLGRRPGARQRSHHVGGATRRSEKVAEELGHGGLAVGTGHADHQEVPCRVLVESRSQPGHDGSHRSSRDPRLHDVVVEQVGDEVLAQEADGTALDCLGGVGVTVAHVAGDTAEEVPRHHPTAVVGDASDRDRGGVADRLDHLDVVEEEVHGHGSHGRPDSVACPGHPRGTSAMGMSVRFT